jgi:hypothetical protein
MKKVIIKMFAALVVVTTSGCFIIDSLSNRIHSNNAQATATMYAIINAQAYHLDQNGKLLTESELDAKLNLKDPRSDMLKKQGYRIDLEIKEKSFKVWLSPDVYDVTGKISYYFDSKSDKIRAADRKGGKANADDPIFREISAESKEILRRLN